jgi:hypothetical protein
MSRATADQQWRSAKKGERELERMKSGRVCHRVPFWAVHVHGFNRLGWWGWDPLNSRWVSAPYGLPFAYAQNLREALQFICWYAAGHGPTVVNWLDLYGREGIGGQLSHFVRRSVGLFPESVALQRMLTGQFPQR